MKFIFDPSNEDELFAARDVINALCNQHSDSRQAIPDSLAAVAPEPKVNTAPAAEELAPTHTQAESIPPIPEPPTTPHPEAMAPPAPAMDFDDVDDAPVVPSAPAQEAAPEVDNQGVPWDGRIHASSKAVTAKGNWKRRRGVDDKKYNQVLAQLMGGVQQADEAVEAATQTAAVLEETAAVPAPPATPDPAEAGFGGNGSGTEMTWPDLVQKVMTAKVQELVSQPQLDKACADLGVTGGFNNLVGRPDLYERFVMELNL